MPKITVLIFLSWFLLPWLPAQNVDQFVVGSAGGSSEQGTVVLMWTIGEPLVETQEGSKKYLTQGFHQGDYVPSTYIFSRLDQTDVPHFEVFPNPVSDVLQLRWDFEEPEPLCFEIYTIQGQCVFRQQGSARGLSANLAVQRLSPGLYLLKIMAPQRHFVEVHRIVKIGK